MVTELIHVIRSNLRDLSFGFPDAHTSHMQLRPRSNTPYPEDRVIQRPRKRPKSPEEYEQLPNGRARKKYISENIASELAALSLRSAAEGSTGKCPENPLYRADVWNNSHSNLKIHRLHFGEASLSEAMMEDAEPNAFGSDRASRTSQSRHTVVVNDLNDSDTASDEEDGSYANHGLPMDRRPGARPKIPEHILKSPQEWVWISYGQEVTLHTFSLLMWLYVNFFIYLYFGCKTYVLCSLNPVRTLVLYSPPVWQSSLTEATEKVRCSLLGTV